MSKKEHKQKNNVPASLANVYQEPGIARPIKIPFFTLIIISLLGGFVAGYAAVFTNDHYFNLSEFINKNTGLPAENTPSVSTPKATPEPETITPTDQAKNIEIIQKSTVHIFIKKESTSTNILEHLYLPKESLGNGLILTSDGWLVAPNNLFTAAAKKGEKPNFVVLAADNQFYDLTAPIIDPLTDMTFFKIAADNLPVAKLALAPYKKTAEALVLFNAAKDKLTVYPQNNFYFKIDAAKDAFLLSEKYYKYILIADKLTKSFLGSPAATPEGEIIGLVNGIDEQGKSTIIPIRYLDAAIKNIFKFGSPKRVFLGVNFIDLSVINFSLGTDIPLNKGALLYEDKAAKIPAVAPDSPAAKAKLQAGDIILKIEKDELNEAHTLPQILQEYFAGQTVKLLILRDKLEQEVDVTLEELK